ncbi:MAG: hypothetical protein GWM90_16685, partial [Gemmatimonadetes bacterium]|nr:hypothetical protein [Gemmatimonadota bacterium]NIQ55926.1 hypothetical protein [Gemmatimonadota bacterium]NIU76124.1 hypothetical protein [Gammaproteobacteria bacterium]NIX45672.1 hypothetical protein [Gemmatimonadota bacterium]NIY09975.1 hypothetical protein [Gemmatimonadota bacterium]
AVAELSAAEASLADASRGGTYPDDFPERLARAELRWRDLAQLEGTPAPALPVAATLALAAAGALFAAGRPALGG